MKHLNLLLLVAVAACDLGETDLGDIAETESSTSGEPGTSGPATTDSMPGSTSNAPTTLTDSGSTTSTSGTSDTPTSDDTLDPGTTSGAEETTSSESGDESSSSTGDPEPMECMLEGCWMECSNEYEAMRPFEGDVPCHGAGNGWSPPPCEEAGAMLCPTLDVTFMTPEEIETTASCFLQALHGDVPGRLQWVTEFPGGFDVSWHDGTVIVVGDGTVLLDERQTQHCGNGGVIGTRYIMSRNLDLVAVDSAAFQACLASDDAEELRACVFGDNEGGVFNPDALPWLAGSCSDEAPFCGF